MPQEELHDRHRDWLQDDDYEEFRSAQEPPSSPEREHYSPRKPEDMKMVCVFDWRVMDDGSCPECGRNEWQWA
jgi:hypothetical protein